MVVTKLKAKKSDWSKKSILAIGIAGAVISLSGCFDGKNKNDSVDVDKALKDKSQLEAYLKKGLIDGYRGQQLYRGGEPEMMMNDIAAEAVDTSNNVSQTNTQEQGVDEADLVKLDGEYLYAYQRPDVHHYIDTMESQTQPESAKSNIRIYKTKGNPVSSEFITSLSLDKDIYDLNGMYLVDDSLAVIGDAYLDQQTRQQAFAEIDFVSPYYWTSRATDIQLVDVSNPQLPASSQQFRFEGSVVGSRRIGNQLYLATKYTPDIPTFYELDMNKNEWAQHVIDLSLEKLLPRYWVNGVEKGRLFEDEGCYLPDLLTSGGYPSVVALIKIDLTNPSQWQAKCSSGRIDGVYASQDVFVMTGNFYNGQTRVDQFSLNDLSLTATTQIPGSLNGAMPSFRLSEQDGYLRVITSSWNDFIITEPLMVEDDNEVSIQPFTSPTQPEIKHRLYVLKANSEQGFDQVAVLPKNGDTKVIGKPREDIKSVRFRGDRAYVVTFLQTDPLYVINLADNENPFIEGELEIEGFSQYLEPIGNDLLLGLGYAADSSGRVEGLKVSLFNIEDPANPTEIRSYKLGGQGSSSEAMWNHKAISFLPMENNILRTSFTWSYATNWDWLANKLHVLDIDTVNHIMTVKTDEAYKEKTTASNYRDQYEAYSRAPLHNDGVHLIVNGEVTSKTL